MKPWLRFRLWLNSSGLARKNIHRELFKCRYDVEVTAQNSPLASDPLPLFPSLYPPSSSPHLCFFCCRRLMGLNEALSVTALKCDSLINKASFPAQHYYFRIRGLGGMGDRGMWGWGGSPRVMFTNPCLNFSVLLTLVVIFFLPARIQKSQPPSCGNIGH